MTPQLLDKGKNILAGDVPRKHRDIEAQPFLHGRYGESTSDREASMSIPTVMERGGRRRCPGPANRGLKHEAGLVNENDGTACTPGFCFSAATLPLATLQWSARRVHGRDVVASGRSSPGGA